MTLENALTWDDLTYIVESIAAEADAYMAEVERHFYVDCPGCHHCVPVPLARCETCGVYGEHSWLCGWERVPA